MYRDGVGVGRYEAAVAWFRLATQQGNANAQNGSRGRLLA